MKTNIESKRLSARGLFQYHDTIGMLSANEIGFSGPVSVDIGPDGNLYVASRGNPNQREAVRISICTKDGDYLGQFGGWGEDEGEFIWVTDIAFSNAGDLFLSEEHTHHVNVYRTTGDFIYSFGRLGSAEGEWNRPSGIAFDSNDDVYVVDSMNHRIQKFDIRGKYLGDWGEFGSEVGQFNMPWGITIDGSDHVYITDWRNDRVQKLTIDGDPIMSFGRSGEGEAEFNRPNGIATDADGCIYVCDWMNDRVQVFDEQGLYLDTLIGHCDTSKWAETYLAASPEVEEKLKLATQNIEPRMRFYRPISVKADIDGKVYVVDCYRHRVQIYQKLPPSA